MNKRNVFTYSMIGVVTGVKVVFMDAAVATGYKRKIAVTDLPVIKDNRFMFSNYEIKRALIRVKLLVKIETINNDLVSGRFTFDFGYSPGQFCIYGIQSNAIIHAGTNHGAGIFSSSSG